MSSINYSKGPSYKAIPQFGGYTLASTLRWTPALTYWGVGSLIGAIFLIEGIPRTRRDILQKIPVIGSYWIDNTPESDKPF
ncbi:hypothetical protein NADFUDRAFT_51928 [Nadsonia fulvescens var. elongata DSM 6958]|uniref:Uncharacterized protein n=1 Tax=Nadsonia fulvescens var. elongata DSM 6958 TaxID=857566 RepID=A0A1E3PJF1_9ASCO|nr:hypothetical protein NADFUDRAFT_51928 [Nadsonia fulvescens var. elongata DSM 6958]